MRFGRRVSRAFLYISAVFFLIIPCAHLTNTEICLLNTCQIHACLPLIYMFACISNPFGVKLLVSGLFSKSVQ